MKSNLFAEPKSGGTVLLIDDSPEIADIVGEMLSDIYRVTVAADGHEGLRRAMGPPKPDLILLDLVMPGMSGLTVCQKLTTNPATRDIPVIILTSQGGEDDESAGLELGAVDYVTKPVGGAILRARIKSHLAMKHARDFMRERNLFLAAEVSRRNRQLEFTRDIAIQAIISLAGMRDNETGEHVRRTQSYVRVLATRLQRHPRFSLQLSPVNIELIYKSAALHDIGKIGIPDCILLKPGRLTPDEFEIMKTHAALGRRAIEQAEQQTGQTAPFLQFAKEIAGMHHERWNGTGYPHGIAGDAIPVSARLMAVADVYDALVSTRVYKTPMTHSAACASILRERGGHFDPDVVDAFAAVSDEFNRIATNTGDSPGLAGATRTRITGVSA